MGEDKAMLRAAACGMIGGAVGLLAMNRSMKLTAKLLPDDPKRELPEGKRASWSLVGEHHEGDEPATEALGRTIYETITGTRPTLQTTKRLGTAVHWGYGVLMGATFGLLRGHRRWLIVDAVGGAAFGTGLWMFGDMLAVPLLGLADKPTRYGLRMHAHTLTGHLVYGLATAAGTRVADRLIEAVD